jgi:hypothetical protein
MSAYAPPFHQASTLRARRMPSASTPLVTVIVLAWRVMVRKVSSIDSASRTGFPVITAQAATSGSSFGYSFAPNPPPRNAVRICTIDSGRSNSRATSSRTIDGFCVAESMTSPPSSATRPTVTFGSSGAWATAGVVNVCV